MKSTVAGRLSVVLSLAFAEGCSDSGAGCPRTVVEECALQGAPAGQPGGIHCVPTLAAAEQSPDFCGGRQGEATCGAYTVITVSGIDTAFLYYYDASGVLAAIASWRASFDKGPSCIGGSHAFSFPTAECSASKPLPACTVPDAGTSG